MIPENTNRIPLDKYYTPNNIASYCIEKVYEVIGEENIEHTIEPSAGNGAFSLQILCDAYDIEPEHNSIKKQDFLELDIDYMKGRLIIGNPPFGSRMNLAQKFFKKSVTIGDYIAFILPISQLWNTNSLFEFDLIHSDDLGKVKYSDRNLNCCFNIYRRPKHGLNTRPKNKLDSIKIVRQDSKGYADFEHDIRIIRRGGSTGKILSESQNYSGEYKIKIDPEFRVDVINVLGNIDWTKEINWISTQNLKQFHIINALKKYIPNIK